MKLVQIIPVSHQHSWHCADSIIRIILAYPDELSGNQSVRICRGWTVSWAAWHRMCLGMFGDFFLKRDIRCQALEGHRRREQLQLIFCRCGLSGVIRGGIMLPNLCRVFSGRHMKKCKIMWCKILQGRVYRYTNVTYFFPANRVFNKNGILQTFLPNSK